MESAAGLSQLTSLPLRERATAELWRRALARMLDALTVFFLLWALSVTQVLWFVTDLARRFAPPPWGQAFVPTVVFAVCVAAHEAYFVHYNHGQTPGMDTCHIRVIGTSEALSGRRCLVRAVPTAALWIVPPLWLGALLVASTGVPAMSRSGTSLNDRLAATRVVRYDRSAEDPDSPPVPRSFDIARFVRTWKGQGAIND